MLNNNVKCTLKYSKPKNKDVYIVQFNCQKMFTRREKKQQYFFIVKHNHICILYNHNYNKQVNFLFYVVICTYRIRLIRCHRS